MAVWYRISDTEWIQAIDVTLNQYGEVSARAGAGVVPSAVQIAPPAPDDSPAHFGITPRVSAEAEVNQGISHDSGISARPEAQLLKFDWLGKIGCWIDSLSILEPLAFNPSIDYFLCPSTLIDTIALLAGGRPIVLASSGINAGALISAIIEWADVVKAVLWDYECDLGTDILLDVKDVANDFGLPLIITTKADADDAVATAFCGFTYADAWRYCDMAAPQFYAQLFGNAPTLLKREYDAVTKISAVPVLPMITTTVDTSDPNVKKFNPISPATIEASYFPLNIPKLITANVGATDAAQWSSIQAATLKTNWCKFGRMGCWTGTATPAPGNLQYNDKIDFYVCQDSAIDFMKTATGGRPILLNGAGPIDPVVFETQIRVRAAAGDIVGVIWDYEFYPSPNEADVIAMKAIVNSVGLPFCASTLGRSGSSKTANDLAFPRAHLYCDFLSPQVYAQNYNHDPVTTKAVYDAAVNGSTAYVIITVTPRTSGTQAQPLMNAQDITANYGSLGLDCVIVWNAWSANQAQWNAFDSLVP